jgi:hypothetical protein
MKITFISDTHNKHNHLTSNAYNNILGSGDVLVHAGDCTSMGKSHEITNFLNWFAMTDFKHKIFIAGNHDFGFEMHTDIAEEFKEKGIIYLFDSEVVIDGVKFYGSPWQPEFYDWAFNLPRGEKLAEKWTKIPGNTDICLFLNLIDSRTTDCRYRYITDLSRRIRCEPRYNIRLSQNLIRFLLSDRTGPAHLMTCKPG